MKQTVLILITLFSFINGHGQKLIIFEKGLYKTGLKDVNGKLVVKPTYTGIVDNGTHFVLWDNKKGSIVMSYDGQILIPHKYKELNIAINRNYYIATGYNYEYGGLVKGYVDLKGNEVIPVKYTDIEDYYKDKYLIVRNKYNWHGVVTAGGEESSISRK